ncbi:MAG TPA: efflux RND transporter periplasmic adaptor subunit [Candidatus Acidoferrales bacterium]|nr:efflux RND transporter periplasmic adaptor subunit [Candidatus Acidoferrales bacterium]
MNRVNWQSLERGKHEVVDMMVAMVACAVTASFIGCGSNSSKNRVDATGTIEATESSIAAQVPGRILKMNYEEGAIMKKGDTLAEIDHRTFQQQVNQAQAAYEMARQQYDLLVKGARSEDLRVAEESVKQAEANFNLAKLALDRTQKLFRDHSVSQSQMDAAQTQYDVASAQMTSAQQNLEKVQHFARPEEIRSAAAQVQQAQAMLNSAQISFQRSYVTSPYDGTVLEKLVEIGDYANIGTPIYTISDLQTMKMTVYVSEVDLARVRLGDDAKVLLDGLPNHPFDGKVIYISPTAEFTPKNVETKEDRIKLVFAVKIGIANPENYLKAGLPADAAIYTK